MPLSWAGVTGGSLRGIVSRAAANEVADADADIEAEAEYRRLDACFREVQEEDARNNKDAKRVMARAIWRCYKSDLKQCAALKFGWSVFTVVAIAYFVRR